MNARLRKQDNEFKNALSADIELLISRNSINYHAEV